MLANSTFFQKFDAGLDKVVGNPLSKVAGAVKSGLDKGLSKLQADPAAKAEKTALKKLKSKLAEAVQLAAGHQKAGTSPGHEVYAFLYGKVQTALSEYCAVSGKSTIEVEAQFPYLVVLKKLSTVQEPAPITKLAAPALLLGLGYTAYQFLPGVAEKVIDFFA